MSYQEIDIEAYKADYFDNADSNHVLIDVREDDEYEAGRIPNAIHIPLGEIAARAAEVPQDKPVVLVCARGGRSGMAAEQLVAQGFTNLINLDGGTMGWVQAGYEVEK